MSFIVRILHGGNFKNTVEILVNILEESCKYTVWNKKHLFFLPFTEPISSKSQNVNDEVRHVSKPKQDITNITREKMNKIFARKHNIHLFAKTFIESKLILIKQQQGNIWGTRYVLNDMMIGNKSIYCS